MRFPNRLTPLIERFRKNEQLFFFSLTGCIAVALAFSFFLGGKTEEASAMESPDTYIPPGHVLVPIDLANGDALSSIVSDFAVVDLFETGRNGNQVRKLVGRRLRLIRAPLDPGKMAVLVHESQAQQLLQNENPLFAVVQNRTDAQGSHLPRTVIETSRIEYAKGKK